MPEMPLARLGGQVLFFAHVPKTGGTSIEAYLRAQGAALALHGAGEGWSRVPLQHLHRAAWEEIVAPGAWDAGFVVLRDPLARLISEFRMRVEPMRPKLRPAGLARMALNRAAGRATHAVRIGGRIEYLDFDAWAARMLDASPARSLGAEQPHPAAGGVRRSGVSRVPVRGRAGAGVSLDRCGARTCRPRRGRVSRATFGGDRGILGLRRPKRGRGNSMRRITR